VTQLKKELARKTKNELIKEIAALCKTFPQVREYYMAQGGDIHELLDKYAGIIEKEFIDGKTRGFPKVRFSIARKALNDFKKLTDDPALIAELMLIYAESVSQFSSDFAPDTEEFYTKPENMFEQALTLIKRHHLQDTFHECAYRIVENACEGWGHRDSLEERYEEVYGEFILAKNCKRT